MENDDYKIVLTDGRIFERKIEDRTSSYLAGNRTYILSSGLEGFVGAYDGGSASGGTLSSSGSGSIINTNYMTNSNFTADSVNWSQSSVLANYTTGPEFTPRWRIPYDEETQQQAANRHLTLPSGMAIGLSQQEMNQSSMNGAVTSATQQENNSFSLVGAIGSLIGSIF